MRKNKNISDLQGKNTEDNYYEGRYMLAFYDLGGMLVYLFDNPSEMADSLTMKESSAKLIISKLDRKKIGRIKLGGEWLTLELIPVEDYGGKKAKEETKAVEEQELHQTQRRAYEKLGYKTLISKGKRYPRFMISKTIPALVVDLETCDYLKQRRDKDNKFYIVVGRRAKHIYTAEAQAETFG